MNLLLVGCSHRTAPVAVRERLALPEPRVGPLLVELLARFGGEALVLSTCNRLELYAAPETAADGPAVAEWLARWHGLDVETVRPHLHEKHNGDEPKHPNECGIAQATRYRFRYASFCHDAASVRCLDSAIVDTNCNWILRC